MKVVSASLSQKILYLAQRIFSFAVYIRALNVRRAAFAFDGPWVLNSSKTSWQLLSRQSPEWSPPSGKNSSTSGFCLVVPCEGWLARDEHSPYELGLVTAGPIKDTTIWQPIIGMFDLATCITRRRFVYVSVYLCLCVLCV